MDKQEIIKKTGEFIFANKGKIIIATGALGLVSDIFVMAKAAPKAAKILEEKTKELGRELTFGEKFDETWKIYLPITGIGILSVGSVILGLIIEHNDMSALATAAIVSQKSFEEIGERLSKEVGPEKAEEIKKEVEKKIETEQKTISAPTSFNVLSTGLGNDICYDCQTGRYFMADSNHIDSVVNDVQKMLNDGKEVTANDWFDMLRLDYVPWGDDVGFKDDISIRYDSKVSENRQPVLIVNYEFVEL